MSTASTLVVPIEHPLETEIEQLAAAWVAPYDQVRHLMRARDWLIELDGSATVEMRLAAMTHDIERMYPGGPRSPFTPGGWGDPFYLYPHQLRCAELVGAWLQTAPPVPTDVDIAEVRRLVGLHEVGGVGGADLVQAADSLSFLEVLAELARDWVRSGVATRETAIAKLRYSVDRIRIPAAQAPAEELFEQAVALVPGGEA